MFIEYLSFGRPSEFIVQSMVLSSLFLVAGRVWTVPRTLVSLGSRDGLVGLVLTGVVISVSVGTVVYLSGRRTYSPLFNQLRHCLVTALLHVLLGTVLVAVIAAYVSIVFGIRTSWPLVRVGASLFFIGSVYALAVAAWHYQRVLSVDYGDGSFENAAQEFLESVRKFDTNEKQVQTVALSDMCDAIGSLERHCAEAKLSDERKLKADIETLREDFVHERPSIQDVVVRGEYWDGSPLEDDLKELSQIFCRVRQNLEAIR